MTECPSAHCIFCNVAEVTKAHVFARSWTTLFDEPNETSEHEVVHRYNDPATGKRHLLKRAKTFALISRNACSSCNSGWLRETEECVHGLMAAFAADKQIVLDAGEQAALALWASAAALLAMRQDKDAADFASPALAESLYLTRTPTAGMDIWLGANSHGEMAWFRAHTLNMANAPKQEGAWGATISFGYAVIHIICHDMDEQRVRLKKDVRRSMRRIWGTQDRVVWPPKARFHALDLSPLAITIGEECSFERAAPRRAP